MVEHCELEEQALGIAIAISVLSIICIDFSVNASKFAVLLLSSYCQLTLNDSYVCRSGFNCRYVTLS